jgi:hypothetical protein
MNASRSQTEELAILKAKVEQLEANSIIANRMNVGTITQDGKGWSGFFDKHGALTILVAIFLQTCGAIWWAATISSQVENLKILGVQRDTEIQKLTEIVEQNAERLTKVQTIQENVVKILDQLSHRTINNKP